MKTASDVTSCIVTFPHQRYASFPIGLGSRPPKLGTKKSDYKCEPELTQKLKGPAQIVNCQFGFQSSLWVKSAFSTVNKMGSKTELNPSTTCPDLHQTLHTDLICDRFRR